MGTLVRAGTVSWLELEGYVEVSKGVLVRAK